MTPPDRSQVVIIGGGVIGCSIAYHLARRGMTDVTVLERRKLTHGSTWHAAGLVGQLRTSASLTQLMRRSVQTYQALAEQTGYPTGWRAVGSLRVAASAGRWEEIRRLAVTGKSFGFDVHLISPREAAGLFPLLRADGLFGASWIPGDGYADPSQLTHSFAAGARAAGVTIVQDCPVTAIERAGLRVTGVTTGQGRVECETLVNATGMWGAQTARMAGADLAVSAVEHQYVVTEKTGAVPRDLPTLRDPDARFYLKPEPGALVIGGWEDGTRVPWRRIPAGLGPELLPPDYDRFEPLAGGAAARVPLFAELGIRAWVNGPIPFSPDAEPLMGVTEDLDNLFHCCGFSAGIAAAGGAGWAMANWIADGDPGLDLWPFDVRRFGRSGNVAGDLEERCIDAYARYYQIGYPNRPPGGPRGQRVSALHGQLRERGAVFTARSGWERADWFGDGQAETPGFGRGRAFAFVAAEHQAARTGAGLTDASSTAKYEICGPGALGLLQKLAAADMDVAAGVIVRTPLLNARGGIESDATIARLGPERFYFLTGAGLGRHDLAFLLQHAPGDGSVQVRDVTSAFGVLALCGPQSRAVAARLTRADLGNGAFGYLTAQHLDLGHAPARALRVSRTGELGWEFHLPAEYLPGLYDRLLDAGEDLGLRDVGYRALESLRLEKQYPAWGTDIGSRTSPFEAGLSAAVRPDKPGLLAGPALRRARDEGAARTLCWFSAGPEAMVHGGELLTHDRHDLAATVRSGGYGHTAGRAIFSAYLPSALAAERDFVVDVATARFPARREDGPLYDPAGTRARS